MCEHTNNEIDSIEIPNEIYGIMTLTFQYLFQFCNGKIYRPTTKQIYKLQ